MFFKFICEFLVLFTHVGVYYWR